MAASEDRADQKPQPCLPGTIALDSALERLIEDLNAWGAVLIDVTPNSRCGHSPTTT